MFYHVIAETKEWNKNKYFTHYELDITDIDVIKNEYVRPFVNGDDFQINGYFINKSGLRRFVVKQTDLNTKELIDNAYKSLTEGVLIIFTREKLIEDAKYSEDITIKLIKETESEIKSIEKKQVEVINDGEIKYNAWNVIQTQFGISKRSFGRKLPFVKDSFKRSIIFRDIEQACFLSYNEYSKPALVLSGSIIEEILRLYLESKGFSCSGKTFSEYLKICDQNGLLKSSINKLSDSIREFRNIIHIEKERSKKFSISKATAIGAFSSIFTIINDMN